MFDLFRSSDKRKKYFLSGLLILVALSMVTYLNPNYGGGDPSPDTVIAQIGRDTVTQRDAQLAIQQILRGKSIPPNLVSLYVPQIIDQLITERILVYEAGRLGFKVSEDDTFNAIHLAHPELFPEGKFIGRDSYAAYLAQQNLTIDEYESDWARKVLVNRLKGVAVEGTVGTSAGIAKEFHLRNDKVNVMYVKLSPEKLKSEVQITPAEMKEFFDRNPASFPTP